MKNVLVVYYTQSGQLLDIAKNVTNELETSEDVNLSFYEIKLKEDFPFPWNNVDFYDAFPESYLQRPRELIDLDNPILQKKYDLIILSYQIWYLTPSIPFNSFLKSNAAKPLLENTPVITLIGCRNMWIMAHEKVKKLLKINKANHVGNIVLADRHPNHISVLTIYVWMYSGIKKRLWGVFPKPGVSDKDIEDAKNFSSPILDSLQSNDFKSLQDNLLSKGAINIKPFLIVTDKRAQIIFGKWANFIDKKSMNNPAKRKRLLNYFSFYLTFAIWVIAPIVFIVYLLTYPFTMGNRKKEKYYFSHTKLK